MIPEEAATPEGISKLPILDRRVVNANLQRFHNPFITKGKVLERETSGTTGTPLKFPVEEAAHREQWAVWWRYWMRHGIKLGTWSGLCGGHPIVPQGSKSQRFWRTNWPLKNVMFSNYHMSKAHLPRYLKEIKRRKLTWLHGYPSSLVLLAEGALAAGIELPQLRWITTGAETLRDMQGEKIRLAFGVDAIQHYGLSEGVANISQCPAGNYHVDEDFSYVELIPHPQIPGVHKIVGTNFANPAFPLIRYDTGDLAVIKEDGCKCGLPGRAVSRILGRVDDYIVTPEGNSVGRLDHIFKGIDGIREAQIVQESPGQLLYRISKSGSEESINETLILERSRQFLGSKMKIAFEYVDKIYRTGSGKMEFVVSHLDKH